MNADFTQIAVLFFVFGGGFWVLAPLARALSKRIERSPSAAGDPQAFEELREELRQVRQEFAELAERVDFTERVLAKQTETQRLPPQG